MNRAPAPALLALHDREMREGARPDGPDDTVERVGRVVRRTAPAHGWNGVVWSDLGADDADAAIAEQVAHYTALGLPFEWKLYGHDLPADLGQRLVAAGFTPEPDETLMAGEIGRLTLDAELPDGVRAVPVTDEAGADQVAAVHERAFGDDASWLRRQLLDRLAAAPDDVVAVLALAGDVPVSAARMELVPGTGFAGLWGGGTVPDWRGRGIYRALVAHRARIAADRGYRYLQVDASAQSRPILERLGFSPLTTTTPYLYEASGRTSVSRQEEEAAARGGVRGPGRA
ncbi:GNAT family N-acetyltransferase [Streptomyces sp. NPDC057092]|uniref:GNAT family N-acetyltransferase n=1 Tax=Streptomyces sp. NPDC057092 TaxID=3346017 RepID=UPI00362F93A8